MPVALRLRLADGRHQAAAWHGGLDTIVPPPASEAVAALLPRAMVKIFPDAGHFFVFDVWGEILEWLLGAPWDSESGSDSELRAQVDTSGGNARPSQLNQYIRRFS